MYASSGPQVIVSDAHSTLSVSNISMVGQFQTPARAVADASAGILAKSIKSRCRARLAESVGAAVEKSIAGAIDEGSLSTAR
jgi:hypothetical protein